MRQTAIVQAHELRRAIAMAGTNMVALAARTREIDPDGKGVSHQLISFLASDSDWSRDSTRPRSASLIEDALSVPRGSLFEVVET